MARLIDADKLKAHYAWWKGGKRELTMDEAKSDFDTIIDLQPTVEPSGMVTFREGDKLLHIDQDALVELWRMVQKGELTEPKHGRWIKGVDEYFGDEMCKCSECGYLNLECEVFNLDGFRYCPNCGARMDEVEE